MRGTPTPGDDGTGGVVIRFRGLHKQYGDVEAVRGIDLTVRKGEILAFLGPNGAGKRRLSRCSRATGSRDAGEVEVLGTDPARPGAGVAGAYWRGLAEVRAGGRAHGRVRRAVRGYYQGLGQWLRRLSWWAWRHRLAVRSAGCRAASAAVDVALALIGDPELVFLDEPTTGFDPAARRVGVGRDHRLRDLGKTIFLDYSYMEEPERLRGPDSRS